MAEETLTHWRKLRDPRFLGSYELPESGEMEVEIISVTKKDVKMMKGKVERLTIAEIKGHKPMILNVKNCKTMTKLAQSPFVEKWVGMKVILFAEPTLMDGEMVDGLRIRPHLPTTLKEREKLTPEHPRWKGALESLQKGNTTIAQIKGVFDISPEHQTLLTAKPKADEAV